MLVSGIKSKPVYQPLRADVRGRYHLMLARGPGGAALLRILEEIATAAPALLAQTRILYVSDTEPRAQGTANSPDVDSAAVSSATASSAAADLAAKDRTSADWANVDSSPLTDSAAIVAKLQSMGPGGVQLFGDAAALLVEFRSILERSLMGTRLYVAGPESFIGLAMRIALEFNLNRDEIRAEESGSSARRVHCVHCRAATEEVRTNIVRCAGCDRWLLVRDHYSRRLAAYMGVMVDAEAPGEVPPIREVYA